MKGSITFEFSGNPDDYRVDISKEGELDSGDLEVVVALINEDIMHKKAAESGRILPTSSEPGSLAQLRDTWSN